MTGSSAHRLAVARLHDALDALRPVGAADMQRRLADLTPERLACLSDQDPSPMDTLGSLVDKLITVDLKMWHNQESLYEIRRMSPEGFAARYGDNLTELHATIQRCCDLNVQRARLMDAIDQHFADAISGDRPVVTMAQHKTY